MLNNILSFVFNTLMYSSPLILAGLGSVISEKSGVVNLGIEGMMSLGAVIGVIVAYFTGNPWLGFIAAGVASGIFALPHAFASVTCRADQTISGIAYNLIGPGLALFLCRIFFEGAAQSATISNKLPKVFGLNINITVVIGIVLTILMYIFMYKTKWGLRVLAVGEHPGACDTLGINVFRTRYICVIVSGVLAGLAGACMTLDITSQFQITSVAGQGFIAIAAVIFGKWTPHGAYGSCIFFGAAQALAISLGTVWPSGSQILAMLPYIITIIVLIAFVGNASAPKANGKPYIKGSRI